MILDKDLNFYNNHQNRVDLEVTKALNNKIIKIKGHLHPLPKIQIFLKILASFNHKWTTKYNRSQIIKKMINNYILIYYKSKFKTFKDKILA